MSGQLESAVISQNTHLWQTAGAGVKPENPVVARLQAGELLRIMGVCSAINSDQLLSLLQVIHGQADILRAPGKKPRTRPVTPDGKLLFTGIGVEKQVCVYADVVKQHPQLLFATEVMSGDDLNYLAPWLALAWIGSRTQEQETCQDVGKAAAKNKVPVMVKNPLTSDLELMLGMVENGILGAAQAVPFLLCLRGHAPGPDTDPKIYRNQPNLHIIEPLKKAFPQLPIILDPSHLFKKEALTPANVVEVIRQGVDQGANGYILELNTPDHPSQTDPGTDAVETLELLTKHNLV